MALNNIFDLKLKANVSATSVTKVVNVTEVTKKISKNEKGALHKEVILQVIDTPGIGALDIPKKNIFEDMKRVTKGKNYILIYCFSVSPTNALTETDKAIIKDLHHALGKDVWRKCVLLFTFSDHALSEFEKSSEKYITHITNHAIEFQKLLKNVSSELPTVKTIFEFGSPEELQQEEKPSGIIAIPVMKKTIGSEDIMPNMIKNRQDWTDVVFIELMKRTDETEREPYLFFKYEDVVKSSARGVMSGAGAAVGAVIGGPQGAVAGGVAGAVVGRAAGKVVCLTVKGVVSIVNLIKKL